MHLTKSVFACGAFALAVCLVPQTHAQTEPIINVPSASPADLVRGSQNIYSTPPSLTLLTKSEQAHSGNIWVRSAADGLHVWGKIEADEQGFRWPRQKSEMLSSDHVEVWLAMSTEIPMPQIGWGNQFGPEHLADIKDCADQVDPHTGGAASGAQNCERWYNEQLQYRQYLRRLFVRQWLTADLGSEFSYQPRVFEDFASTAYAGLVANFFPEDLPSELKPKPDDGVKVEISYDVRPETKHDSGGRAYTQYHPTGYRFHVFIPYGAFPPAPQLQLADLYLMVDVFSSAPEGREMGDFSSTSATRQWGQPATFNHVRLASPRVFTVTPCEYSLEQKDDYDAAHPSWFFPTASATDSVLRSTFALTNPAQGYMYEPGSVSPEAVHADYFWKQIQNGAIACGPDLAWRRGGSIERTQFWIDGERFEALVLPDGWTLLRSGPTASTLSRFGSGACGSCATMTFDIFAVSPEGKASRALSLYEILSGTEGQPSALDMTIAPDWKRVILFREIASQLESGNPWNSVTYCLADYTYSKCAESNDAHPPDPPHFKEFRDLW